jgi:predicted nucleic-acid-binding protein
VIGLDTNILVRYFAQDDPIQSPRANQIIEGLTESSPGFISLVALAETVWVLERSYGLSSAEIANVIRTLLQASSLVVQNEVQVYAAMSAVQSESAGFSDALIGALGTWAACRSTLTFDRKAAHLSSFQLA